MVEAERVEDEVAMGCDEHGAHGQGLLAGAEQEGSIYHWHIWKRWSEMFERKSAFEQSLWCNH
jgi:hypothetical protein